MRTEFLCISVLRVASGPSVKLASCKTLLNPTVVYSTDRSKTVVPVLVLLICCFVVYSTRRFVLCLTLCHFVLVFFSPFSIAITSLGEERANLSFVRFVLVWICRFPLPLSVWERLRFVIVALPGLFSYLFSEQEIQLSLFSVFELSAFGQNFCPSHIYCWALRDIFM